jgi:hypothetical protein
MYLVHDLHPKQCIRKLVPIHKWQICPLSALHEKFNPRNINYMPVVDSESPIGMVKFFVRLDLDQIILFLDGHQLALDQIAIGIHPGRETGAVVCQDLVLQLQGVGASRVLFFEEHAAHGID